jgi:hypothetical protein
MEAQWNADTPDRGQKYPHLRHLCQSEHAQAKVNSTLHHLHIVLAFSNRTVEALFPQVGPFVRRGLHPRVGMEVARERENREGEGVRMGQGAAGDDLRHDSLLVKTRQRRMPLVEKEGEEFLHQVHRRQSIFRQPRHVIRRQLFFGDG